ncbi:MAG: hypothetical protein HZA91_12445 [Verrucomicrobia bacterium]|nr:hypothetical protein [Verrucomicrobiota bacterium]
MDIEQQSPQNDFVAECKRAFAFLVQEHGFAGPEVDVSTPGLVFATYQKGTVGIECMFEQRDDDASVKVIRLISGNRPTVYRKDDAGVVVREYLTELLLHRGVSDISFPQPAVENGLSQRRAKYRRRLEGSARMLRNYAQDVLGGSDRILNEVR